MREDTLQIIEEYSIKTAGNKKNIEKAEVLVSPDEKIFFIAPTNMIITTNNTRKKEKLPGVIILTDQRVLFYYQIMFNSSTEIIPLNEIRSINAKTNGLTAGHIELYTMTKSYDILVSYKRDMVQKIVRTFEKAKNEFSVSTGEVSKDSVQNNNAVEQIEKLFELNQKGILTDEEFKIKKEELLKKI